MNLDYWDSAPERGPVAIDRYPEIDWMAAVRTMILIRLTEEKIGENVENKTIRCPCHLSIGQEAIPAGISLNLRPTDFSFGNHRSHGHYLAMGGDVHALLAETLGKVTGCSRGMGGSMHIVARDKGFTGSVPIVAGTIPIAVGAGLAARLRDGDAVSVAFFGDGATEEGVFHESLNFAAAYNSPTVFVCENNLFSSHMHVTLRQPEKRMARFAEAHDVLAETVDGNDVVAVYGAARRLIDRARHERKPAMLEAVTYRWKAHVGPTEDLEIGFGRRTDLPNWKRHDPIRRLADALIAAGATDTGAVDRIWKETTTTVENAWQQAMNDPYPPESQLLDTVYAPRAAGGSR